MGFMPCEVCIDMVKSPKMVPACSGFCYCAVRELGVELQQLLLRSWGSQLAGSIYVKRGEKIAKEKGFEVLER